MKSYRLSYCWLAIIIGFSILLTGCKKEEGTCIPSDYSGYWEGTWESSKYDISGTFVVMLIQTEGKLTGTISIPDIGMENESLSGNVCGNTISFGDINKTIKFTGSINNDSIGSGNYSYPSYNDKGTWSCYRPDKNSSYHYPTDTINTNYNAIFLDGASSIGQYFFVLSANHIFKISAAGLVVDTISAPGMYQRGLACDGDNLFVGDNHWGTSTIYRLNETEQSIIKIHGNGNSNGLAFQDNNLWNLDGYFQKLYKCSFLGTLRDSFALSVFWPKGLAADGDYLWYSVDLNGQIVKIDTLGNTIQAFSHSWGSIAGIAVAGDKLWIADGTNNKIYRTTKKLDLEATINSPTSNTAGIAFDGSCLWVLESDYLNARAYKISTDGTVKKQIHIPGDNGQKGGFTYYNKNLYYSLNVNKEIYKLDTSGNSCIIIPSEFDPGKIAWINNEIWGISSSESKFVRFNNNGVVLTNKTISWVSDCIDITTNGQDVWVLKQSSMASSAKIQRIDNQCNVLETQNLFLPQTDDKRFIIEPYGLFIKNNSFYLIGKGPFDSFMKIYEYKL